MKPSLLLYSLILIAPAIEARAQPAQPHGATLYVAPGGKDAAAGTQAEPLASLAGARDRVRQLKQEGAAGKPISVVFADGTYELAEAVVFGPQDSGAEKAPVTYRAEHPGKVIFSGGKRVTGWTLKGEGVWTAPIESGRDFYQLFVNGERRQRARTPNSGYLKSFGPARPVANFAALDKKDLGYNKQFRFRDQDFQNWPDLADALVIYYHSWLVSLHWIERIDPAQGIVTLRNPAGHPFGHFDNQQERYVIENIKSAFDAPGEWYLDKPAGELLYRPLPGEDMAKAEAVAPVALRLLELVDVGHLAFEGLSFRYSDWRLDKDAFRDQQAFANVDSAPIFGRKLRHSRFENCEIALAGAHAVVLREGCQYNVIRQCHIHDMAGGGIYLGPVSAIRPKTPQAELAGHNTVDNCFIHNLNHTFHGSVGVLIAQASDNSVTHNDISEFDYTGISVGWTWDRATNTNHRNNRIEKNRIHHLMQGVLSDGGGIYTTGYLNAGTVVRGNVVHDIHHHKTHCSAKGIYLDGNSSDIVVENNLCYDISSLGIQTKGERNQIRNNIFAYCGVAGQSRGRQDQEGKYTHEANHYNRNIVYMDHAVMARGELKPPLCAFDHQLYWNRKRPGRAVFVEGHHDGNGAGLGDDSDSTDSGRLPGKDESSVVADPGFVHPEQRDFRLNAGSPAEKIGFVPFDFSDAGLYGDPAWTARPANLTHRALETVEPDGLAFSYDFEDHHEGMMPMTCWKAAEKDACALRISSAQAASGSKSLLFQDGADAPSYFPNLILERPYADGRYRLSMKLWQDPADPAELTIGTRSGTGTKYLTGVGVVIRQDGGVFAGKRKLGTLPQGEWITLELTFGSGAEQAGSYDVSAVLANGTRLEAARVPVADAAFQKLGWIGVIASGKKGRFYLDDLELSAGAAIPKATLPQTK